MAVIELCSRHLLELLPTSVIEPDDYIIQVFTGCDQCPIEESWPICMEVIAEVDRRRGNG